MGTGLASSLWAPANSFESLPPPERRGGKKSGTDWKRTRTLRRLGAQHAHTPGGMGGEEHRTVPRNKGGQANRLISTGQLNALLHLHLRPINLVVFEEPVGISYLGGGFTLICLQRLSFLNVATLLCPSQDNRHARGSADQILSY